MSQLDQIKEGQEIQKAQKKTINQMASLLRRQLPAAKFGKSIDELSRFYSEIIDIASVLGF